MIATIDFEASGTNGYPIEVGVAIHTPDSPIISVWSSLIKPTVDWLQTMSWDPVAAQVHGIARQELKTAPTACGTSPHSSTRCYHPSASSIATAGDTTTAGSPCSCRNVQISAPSSSMTSANSPAALASRQRRSLETTTIQQRIGPEPTLTGCYAARSRPYTPKE
jgi:hypothetical protein